MQLLYPLDLLKKQKIAFTVRKLQLTQMEESLTYIVEFLQVGKNLLHPIYIVKVKDSILFPLREETFWLVYVVTCGLIKISTK